VNIPDEFKSRKLITWAVSLAAVFLSGIFAADKINPIIMGILGCLTIYHGGNVSAGWIAAKANVTTTATSVETENPPKTVTVATQKPTEDADAESAKTKKKSKKKDDEEGS
jgi:hypothetical protein